MATVKQIKKRKKTVDSTGKITKAMKLVATVKLQKAKQLATDSAPYFDASYETITSILKHTKGVEHKYLNGNKNGKKAIIVISANKGLAGGYNSSIVKSIISEDAEYKFDVSDTLIYAIGTKARDDLKRRGYTIEYDDNTIVDEIHYGGCLAMADKVLDDFTNGKVNEIYLVYSYFKNTIVHIPRVLKLLPVDELATTVDDDLKKKNDFVVAVSSYDDKDIPMNYDMEDTELIDKVIPQYIAGLIFGAVTSAMASENGARMTAMDNATKNAEELGSTLEMLYNRARQGAITQEITEIIGGANAL